MDSPLRVLMVTSEWPSPEHPAQGSFIARQADFVRRAGVEVDIFSFRGERKVVNYLRVMQSLRKRCAQDDYTVLHAQFGHSGALASLVNRQPMVVTFHGSDVFGIAGDDGRYVLASHPMRYLSTLAARRADAAVLVTARMEQHLPPRDYHLVPCGVDLSHFVPMPRQEARRRLGLHPTLPLVLFAGNPAMGVKRYGLAKAAMGPIRGRMAADLLVVRDQPPQVMPLYMNACDALLLTSVHEGSPNVIKEALACNLPVVSVDVGDVAERLRGIEGCALLPQTANGADLAAPLLPLLQRPRRCRGRQAVLPFDEPHIAKRLIAIYHEVSKRSAWQLSRRAAS